ncbi:MAG TPA: hypothetical protein VMD52_02720 [Patescibacteria group bacterium]|nr:hypothetical protein [Patescibacteria group bacterium]
MIENSKGRTVVFVLLIAVALLLAGGIYYLYNQEYTKNVSLQKELEEVKTQQKIAETKLSESKETITSLETKLKGATTQIETLNKSLDDEKTARQETLAQVEKMKMDMTQLSKVTVELEAKLNKAQAEAQQAQTQIADLETKRNELEVKIKDLQSQTQEQTVKAKEGVELGKIVVNSETGAAVESAAAQEAAPAKLAPGAEGKVLVVNKEYDFAVINLGIKDGVSVGMVFSAYRGNKYLGDLRIEKVHESMAAAGFTTKEIREKLKEGDRVVPKS